MEKHSKGKEKHEHCTQYHARLTDVDTAYTGDDDIESERLPSYFFNDFERWFPSQQGLSV